MTTWRICSVVSSGGNNNAINIELIQALAGKLLGVLWNGSVSGPFPRQLSYKLNWRHRMKKLYCTCFWQLGKQLFMLHHKMFPFWGAEILFTVSKSKNKKHVHITSKWKKHLICSNGWPLSYPSFWFQNRINFIQVSLDRKSG